MTTLSITDIAAVIAHVAGAAAVRYPTKDKATAKLEAVLASVVGETGAHKAAAAILACASRDHALDAASNLKAEAARDARVIEAAATMTSPGLARLRAHPKAEAIRQQTQAEAAAVTTGVYPFQKSSAARKAALAVIAAEAPAPAPVAIPKPVKTPKPNSDHPRPEAERSRAKIEAEGRIAAVVENPKKPGSRAHACFSVYRAGQTVAEFIAACGAAGIPEKEARSNIAWDRRKGFITVEAGA